MKHHGARNPCAACAAAGGCGVAGRCAERPGAACGCDFHRREGERAVARASPVVVEFFTFFSSSSSGSLMLLLPCSACCLQAQAHLWASLRASTSSAVVAIKPCSDALLSTAQCVSQLRYAQQRAHSRACTSVSSAVRWRFPAILLGSTKSRTAKGEAMSC